MINGLNIPLNDPTTRRNSWRVVWILFIGFFVFSIFWIAFRVLTHIDRVSDLRPQNASYSITFDRTARTSRILSDQMGQDTAFLGQPWVFQDFFNLSKSAISLHYDNDALSGISVDRRITPAETKAFIDRDLFVYARGGQTLIATSNEHYVSPNFWHDFRLSFEWILPRNSGIFLNYSLESNVASSLRINERGITIREKNPIPERIIHFDYPESLHILAFAPLYEAPIGQFLPILDEKEALVMLGEDGSGLAVYLSAETGEIDIDELAAAAQEIINRQSLSTTALTLPDGESVREIRTQQGSLTPTIISEGDIKDVFIKNTLGDVVQINQVDGVTTISNRSFTRVQDGILPYSTCNPHYPFFARVEEVAVMTFEPTASPLLPPDDFSSLFSEIAWRSKRTLLCW